MTYSQQTDFDMLLVNLRMDAGFVREGMNINWKAEVRPTDNESEGTSESGDNNCEVEIYNVNLVSSH